MKTMKKLASLLLALAMIFALAVTASAQTITVTPPAGMTGGATYKIYKVFDATVNGENISYKLVEGKTTVPAGFNLANSYVTYAGTGTALSAADIAAIAAYVTEADLVDTLTASNSQPVTSKDLPAGYYYITTSTGSLVTVDSNDSNVVVDDKNKIPTVDKVIASASNVSEGSKQAMAQLGSEVWYTATIVVGKGTTNYVFHDCMDDSLTYQKNATVAGIDAEFYTIQETPDEGDTLTITFADGLAEDTEITIRYSAIINDSALNGDPANNRAWVSYGDYNTTEVNTAVYNAQFTVTKQDANNAPLAGAGFVIKNEDKQYYCLSGKTVTWVGNIDEATEYSSDATGAVPAFTGLANGIYYLEEKTVPAGYNKAADYQFEIKTDNYTAANLAQQTTVINQAGTELPTTGGMGTTLFYTLGGILVVAAIVLLVTKKRMSAE